MRLQRIATSVISSLESRLSSSSSRKSLGIASPLVRDGHQQQARSSTAPSFAWNEKRSIGITTPEELERRINDIKVCVMNIMHKGHLCNFKYVRLSITHVSLFSQTLANEARLCIRDCAEIETTSANFDEELQSAKLAVDVANVTYSELLEELAVTNEGVEVLNDVRKLYAPEVEELRQELKRIQKVNDGEED